ncbi:ketosteroid isomerase-like protein [Murinocardiopsis flavida]|uniref:Ketosteroid isomerase-like protein n=1 Tax=Murinocardiopsis flavida TaxID=645275 RepID=A0A2P8DNW2_9ACTN|nr:nuclear transport factor 2 family protein [Murinocardiopsis flavida]PSK98914.1 ketosteroid isomerase-like protein [Murinocardiopsis flavida]
MTSPHDDPTGPAPGTDPAQHATAYAAAFNAGDAAALDRAYEPGGVVVPHPGHPARGPERSAATAYLLGLGLPMDARVRHTYVAGDIALLIVDWSMRGTALDGTAVDFAGTASDVLRRGPDGCWRYVIDNPFGTA